MPITVFYDAKCGLCAKEITYYQTLVSKGDIIWLDVNEHANQLQDQGISLADALMYLHVLDQQGDWYIGVDAFIQIWHRFARWRWLARFVDLPFIHGMTSMCYKLFAKWRFQRLAHCKASVSL